MKRAGIPGVSIYKPSRRRGRQHKYLVSYKENGRRKVQSVSTDRQIAIQYAMQVSQRLDRKRLGLLSDREERLIQRAASPLGELLAEFTKLRRPAASPPRKPPPSIPKSGGCSS